jgi:hypothetical protein
MSFRKSCFAVLFRWHSLTLAVILLVGLSVSAQAMTVDPQAPKATPSAGQTSADASNDDLAYRIKLLELKAADPGDTKSAKVTVPIATAIIGCIAVMFAALIGIVGQILNAKNAAKLASDSLTSAATLAANEAAVRSELARKAAEDAAELARDAALHKRAEQMIEFKLKQIECFYAPIFAAFRQSKTLYDKMLQQLVRDVPTRYSENPLATGKEFRFRVTNEKGEVQGFYLVDELPAIKGYGSAMQLIDLTLDLGKSICTIITTHAGLASEDLIEDLGKYMAHHAILSAIRNGPDTKAFEPGTNKLGAFPFGLDTRIEQRLKELSKDIDDYDKGSSRSLSLLSEGLRERSISGSRATA